MKLLVEIDVSYPDLSTDKHVMFLRHLFNNVNHIRCIRFIEYTGKDITILPRECECGNFYKNNIMKPTCGECHED
jgi:hypothetical protein